MDPIKVDLQHFDVQRTLGEVSKQGKEGERGPSGLGCGVLSIDR